MWHGYVLIEIDTPLTGEQKQLAKTALLQLATQAGLPHQITHLRPSSDGQKVIVEAYASNAVTKVQACNKLATLLPWTAEQISNNTAFTRSPGDNWEERRQTTVAYICNHKSEWGEEE